MISKRQTNHPLTIQLPDMVNSVTSQGSISNFVAQTPKQNRHLINFKRTNNISKLHQQKENTLQAINNNNTLQVPKKNQLPYKMVTSELPSPCSNHKDKESSFYIESEDNELIFYCQKCAILVASQGFQVKKIESSLKQKNQIISNTQGGSVRFSIKDTKTVKKSKIDYSLTKQQKQTQLTNFLNNLERIQSRIDYFDQKNQSSLIEIDSAAENQVNKIKQLFSSIHKVLDKLEQGYLNELQTRISSLREPLQNFAQDLNNDTQTLESMKEDICQAYDQIINHTTETQFETVMQAYVEDTTQIQEALNQKQTQSPSIDFKKELYLEVNGDQIIQEVQKQVSSRIQSVRRQSIKSTKRRISIGGPKIR